MSDKPLPDRPPVLGVFDSGVGGLTVLRELRTLLPEAALHYVADTAYAPYGNRSPQQIRERSLQIAAHLMDEGARLIVVACNTATAHAIDALRDRWPGFPFVGTEPGIKPAIATTRTGRIGVLATPATAMSSRLNALVERHAQGMQITLQPCPGIVDFIEAGDLESAELKALVTAHCAPLKAANVDTVLLGCTHYPLITPLWQAELGSKVRLLHIETAVARRALELWRPIAAQRPQDAPASTRIETSGPPEVLQSWLSQVLGWRNTSVGHWAPAAPPDA